jgi:hypothetical protein
MPTSPSPSGPIRPIVPWSHTPPPPLAAPVMKSYRVGIHARDDYGWGPSLATVRVWIFSQLVFELPGIELLADDFREVARIDWPSGKVTKVF